jgi:CYTH domain-containing protein
MALEIEWKFVVTRLPALPEGAPETIDQGYFCGGAGVPAVRVRLKGRDGALKGTLDVKAEVPGSRHEGGPQVCREFAYAIPAADAEELLPLAAWRIRKRRWTLPSGIELDVFDGPHRGLVVAEMEVPEGTPAPPPPPGWEWRDVSSDVRYVNRMLAELGTPPDAPRCRTG